MVEKSKLLLDVDDVIVDNAFLSAINVMKGTNYKEGDFESYYFDREIFNEEEIKQFHKFLLSYDIYSECILMQYVEEILPIICDCLDVYISSACVMSGMERESGILFARKYNFLVKRFPYINPNNIILLSNKNMFCGIEYQIDDRFPNLYGKVDNKFLFNRHHNSKISRDLLESKSVMRVENWLDIIFKIKELECKNGKSEFWKPHLEQIEEI